jgi:hypothetical protein
MIRNESDVYEARSQKSDIAEIREDACEWEEEASRDDTKVLRGYLYLMTKMILKFEICLALRWAQAERCLCSESLCFYDTFKWRDNTSMRCLNLLWHTIYTKMMIPKWWY